MSAISRGRGTRHRAARAFEGPRADDPRVVRTRAAIVEAARVLFLRKGYAGTTMDDVALQAGLAKRSVYNNYADKGALFTEIVAEVIAVAEAFAQSLRAESVDAITVRTLAPALHELGERLAVRIVRQEVIALRRLLIGEAREFPELARDYFDRAPGQVIDALAERFHELATLGMLRLTDAHRAAAQFAYLVAGEPLDRAMLVGTVPPKDEVIAAAHDGVDTFLARYARRPA